MMMIKITKDGKKPRLILNSINGCDSNNGHVDSQAAKSKVQSSAVYGAYQHYAVMSPYH